MSTQVKHNKLVTLLVITVLLLASLACGENATPAKVGEVGNSEPVEEAVSSNSEPAVDPDDSESAAPEESEDGESSSVDEADNEPVTEGPTSYEVGDIVNIGDTVMVVLGWETPEGDDFTAPDEGKQFVAVELLFVNQGTDTDSISSMLQMELKDETGQKYSTDFAASMAIDSDAPDGEIGPGERVRGKVGFHVPEDAGNLVFVFDADVFGTGKVFVGLGDEPVTIEPPAEIAGEQAVEAYAVGDVVKMGDMLMTVNGVTYPEGDEWNVPDEGKKFVVVDVTFENQSDEAESISSMMQMELKDSTGQKYSVDFSASVVSGGTSPDGEMAPGEKVRGQVGYQVPVDADGLMFVFDADVFGYGKAFVALP